MAPSQSDDAIRRLNIRTVPIILIGFTVLSFALNFGIFNFEPMHCLHSRNIVEAERELAMEICHSNKLFYILQQQQQNDEGIALPIGNPQKKFVYFYEFVPFMLLIQAALFCAPNWLLVNFGRQTTKTWLYVLVKLLCLANVVTQFVLFDALTGHWGLEVLTAMITGGNLQDLSIFPRLITCDCETFHYIIQCHLRINVYNGKIFFIIWWLLLGVAVLTLFDFVLHLLLLFCSSILNDRVDISDGMPTKAGGLINMANGIAKSETNNQNTLKVRV